MSISEAEKKRRQRQRAKQGSRVLSGLEIVDWDAWIEILRADGILHGIESPVAVRLATERYIWDECRAYRREQAQDQLNQILAPITGLIDRETEPGPVRLIKAKDVKRPDDDPSIYAAHDDESDADDGISLWEAVGLLGELGIQSVDDD